MSGHSAGSTAKNSMTATFFIDTNVLLIWRKRVLGPDGPSECMAALRACERVGASPRCFELLVRRVTSSLHHPPVASAIPLTLLESSL